MSTLASQLKASIQWLFQEPLALATVGNASQLAYDEGLANGVGVDQADRIWSDERTVASGANDDLDLTALGYTLYGSSVSLAMARVKAILIIHTSTTSGERLTLDSSVTHSLTGPFGGSTTSLIEIGADSPLLLASKKDGWPTSGTDKILRIHNSGAASATYTIVIVGTSA